MSKLVGPLKVLLVRVSTYFSYLSISALKRFLTSLLFRGLLGRIFTTGRFISGNACPGSSLVDGTEDLVLLGFVSTGFGSFFSSFGWRFCCGTNGA